MPKNTKLVIAAVQQICQQKKLRLTAVRQEVLELLLKGETDGKAYTLLDSICQQNKRQPTAVYRALNFLLEHGFAHKVHSKNKYVACHHPTTNADCYFLICEGCGRVDECCSAEMSSAIAKDAKLKMFKPKQSFLEVFGWCKKCKRR